MSLTHTAGVLNFLVAALVVDYDTSNIKLSSEDIEVIVRLVLDKD